MCLDESFLHLPFQEYRQHGFNSYLMLFVQLADFSAERMCARLCAESALSFQIIAAGIVVANAPASGFKQGIAYLVGLCLRYEGNQFQQLVF
jgi:hypothetical protein